MGSKSNYAENAVLDWLLGGSAPTRPTSRNIALYTASPGEGTAGTEVSTGSWTNYARVAATFAAASGGSAANSGDVDFGTATTTGNITLTGWAIIDHLGNVLYYADFAVPQIIQNGNSVKFAAGALVISED